MIGKIGKKINLIRKVLVEMRARKIHIYESIKWLKSNNKVGFFVYFSKFLKKGNLNGRHLSRAKGKL